jgi:phage-related holin
LFQVWAWKNQNNNSDLLTTTRCVLLTLINVIEGSILLGMPMPESLDKVLSI